MSRAFAPKYIAEGTTIGPYTPAVRVGNFLFLSGQIGLDPASGNLKADSIETETRQVLRNIDRLLRAEGFDSSNVISASVYLREMNNFARMNAIYGSYFPQGKYPVRTTVAVADLPKRANVEIAVIAYK
ncbi:MAG: RidA family protein [Ignavibacteriae bacterium]|nr:RidA family protein [Ignavibacteriota bacterium]